MKCVALRHVAFEDLGLWEAEIAAHGYAVEYVDAGVDDLAPVRDADLVVVLGGPIGIGDAGIFPFIDEETALVKERLDAGLPTFGSCFGMQVMAHALGWPVAIGQLELGFGVIDVTEAGMTTPLRHMANTPILQWHADFVTPPAEIEILASTSVTACQAFAVGNSLAIQFHPEVGPEAFERWLIGNLVELRGLGVSIEQLRAEAKAAADAATVASIGMIREYLRSL